MPSRPKLPRKPKNSASLATKERYLQRIKEMQDAYKRKCTETVNENALRIKEKAKSERLSKEIAGISGTTVFSGSAKRISTAKRRKTKVSGTKKATKKKAAPKKKKTSRRR